MDADQIVTPAPGSPEEAESGLPEEAVDENAGMEVSGTTLLEQGSYTCPRCSWSFKAKVVVSDLEDPEGEDVDFCPHGAKLSFPEQRLVSCPTCGYTLPPEMFGAELASDELSRIQQVQFESLVDDACPWQTFDRAALAVETLGYGVGSVAFLYLEGAWSARRHGNIDAEGAALSLALERFEQGLSEGVFDPQTAVVARLVAAECSRRLGLFAPALEHLDAFDVLVQNGKLEEDDEQDLPRRASCIREALDARDVDAKRFV